MLNVRKYPLYSLHALLLLLIACLLFTACGGNGGSASNPTAPTPKAVTLKVFAAASLTESFKEIGTGFQAAHKGVTVTFNFAGSQALVQQLKNGAPGDVFASADQANMTAATTAGLVGDAQVFAKNKLVLIIPVNNPGKINTLKDLANKGVKIDIEAPTVPAGKYTRQILDKMGKSPDYGTAYENAVKANFVSQEDNVKAVVTKVQLGEADAGFVYLTDVTAQAAQKVTEVTIPDNFNIVAEYPIATTKNAADATDAKAFVQYVLSADGQAILQKAHFTTVSGGA